MTDRFLVAVKRKVLREKAIAFKGGKCQICGYNRCLTAMEFHHPDPMEKDFSISTRITSWKAIEKELEKCVLLCANCHREVHDGLHPSYLDDPDAYRGQMDDSFEDETVDDDNTGDKGPNLV